MFAIVVVTLLLGDDRRHRRRCGRRRVSAYNLPVVFMLLLIDIKKYRRGRERVPCSSMHFMILYSDSPDNSQSL